MTGKQAVNLLRFEEEYYAQGFLHIAGVDEVGRGPLAGPVVACAVILPPGLVIDGVDDSKKLSPKKREKLSALIMEKALSCAISEVDAYTVDRINILQASLLAMKQAVERLTVPPEVLIVDGNFAPDVTPGITVKCLPHGDALSQSVAAASIAAKVYRDALMVRLHEKYPQYGFDKHKGYGTAEHLRALREYGPCPEHRRSFKPMRT